MINYSIVMRPVNANLIQINQAKGRIAEAKKNNQEPAQEDLDLVKTEVLKAYAVAQYAEVMDINKFAKHITDHGCVYSRADISAILYMAVDCMREMLLEGKKIRLGDLGDFSISLSSKPAESADKFNSQNITGVSVNWESGKEFKNLYGDAEFNLVASRSAQAAVLKALKDGKTVVDLNAKEENTDGENPDDGGDNGGGNPSGGNTSGGQQTGDNTGGTTGTGGNTSGGQQTGGSTTDDEEDDGVL